DDVRLTSRIGHFGDFQPRVFGGRPRLRATVQANHDVKTRVMRVEGVRMTLATVANNGNALACEGVDGCVGFGVDVCGHFLQLTSFKRSALSDLATAWPRLIATTPVRTSSLTP